MTQKELTTNVSSDWDALISKKYLKADDVDETNDKFVIVSHELRTWEEDERPRLVLTLENEKLGKVDFDCNKTNATYLSTQFPEGFKQMVGRFISFDKVRVFSPHHKKEVDSLRIKVDSQK